MKKLALMLFVLLFLVPFGALSKKADAQVVVQVGPRYHHPYYHRRYYHRRYYHRRYYHRRYYHHPYHRY